MTNHEHQQALVRELSISRITASILIGRDLSSVEQARRWLSQQHDAWHDPFLLPDMERAVDRLHQAVMAGERICFYGDYDVDGISATGLYLTFFRNLGADAIAYLPHRIREGYGLNEQALHWLQREGVRLLVTSDCGTTAHREAETAGRLGLDVIITDHHQPDDRLPPALAVLNPQRGDSSYPFDGLCSGGLAFKVVQAYERKFGVDGAESNSMLDLVALATVADVVPLRDENRMFVREGLRLISRGARCGIRALKQIAGVERDCTAGTVSFRLAPRINAAGRLAHAETSLRLLTTEDDLEAKQVAEGLELLNRERQRIEAETTAEALAEVESGERSQALVLAASHWHLGVVGIVAARLVERYHRPAVVLAVNDQGIAKGSARSVPGFDVYRALLACRDVLEGCGGHPAAAGLTLRASRMLEFKDRFSKIVGGWVADHASIPVLHIDTEVSLRQIDPPLVRELELLSPFGAGNPEPTLMTRNLSILNSRVVGDGHLKLTVRQEGAAPIEGIGFRLGPLGDRGLSAGQAVDLAFIPELNRWNGLERVQLRVRDLKASRG